AGFSRAATASAFSRASVRHSACADVLSTVDSSTPLTCTVASMPAATSRLRRAGDADARISFGTSVTPDSLRVDLPPPVTGGSAGMAGCVHAEGGPGVPGVLHGRQ